MHLCRGRRGFEFAVAHGVRLWNSASSFELLKSAVELQCSNYATLYSGEDGETVFV